jgi:hypothetical protein
LIILLYTTAFTAANATVTSARAKSLLRFKRQCDDEGIGRACYDYGRALWSTPGVIDRKTAKVYLLRACELKYMAACEAYQAHSSFRTRVRQKPLVPTPGEAHGSCFTPDELGTARLSPNIMRGKFVQGHRIDNIKPTSFWAHVGLHEGDVISRVNNMAFNTSSEILTAFSKSGKKFGFEVVRGGDTIVLWYTCQ